MMQTLPRTLYNISFNTDKLDPKLNPKIPFTAMENEDYTTPRVCFASSIENCIQAIAPQNRYLHDGSEIVIRYIDTDELDPLSIITPEELVLNKQVPDAMDNQEYWYLEPIVCELAIERIRNFECYQEINWGNLSPKLVREIVEKYTDTKDVTLVGTTKGIYNAFVEEAEAQQRWDDIDAVWDRLAALSYSHQTIVENINFY